jgi:hypothetical protein
MISAAVIVASLVLAVAFALMFALKPDLREEVERPKHWFVDQVRRYDLQCQDDGKAPSNEASAEQTAHRR